LAPFQRSPDVAAGGYLIVAAVLQLILHGLFKTFGIVVPILETPHWVSLGFVAFAAVLLVADRLLPERAPIPRPNPNDVDLFKRFRALFDEDTMYFLRTHNFESSFDRNYFNVLNEISAAWVGSAMGS
jgi:hypothetical protein